MNYDPPTRWMKCDICGKPRGNKPTNKHLICAEMHRQTANMPRKKAPKKLTQKALNSFTTYLIRREDNS